MAETLPTKTVYAGRLMLQMPVTAVVKNDVTFEGCDAEVLDWGRSFDALKVDIEKQAAIYNKEPMKREAWSDAADRAGGLDPDKIYAKTRLIGFSADARMATIQMGYHTKNDTTNSQLSVDRLVDNKRLRLSMGDNGAERYLSVIRDMVDVSSRFVLLPAGKPPDQPGFAIPGGVFRDPPKPWVWEEFTLTAKLSDHPDVRFFINSRAIRKEDKDEPSLSTRASREISMLRESAPDLKVLAKESHTAADQKGYIVGISAPYDSEVPGARLRKFFWSADGVPNDVTRPFLEMELMIEPTKETGDTFKDDKDAQEFFNRMLDSLQIRPGAV